MNQLPRRTFLKGTGTAMALPLLEAMVPAASAAPSAEGRAPTRMAFVFFPNGAIMENWKPQASGSDFELSATLQPLAKYKQDILLFSGLTQHHGRANGDGAGDHARNASSFLTGAQPYKTASANIRVGVSADQAIAAEIGRLTKLPSLELGIERGRNAGNCDSGYSCAYSSNISWKTASTPMAKEIVPKLAFQRLFGSKDARKDQKRRELYRKSILDLVANDAARLKTRLGQTDRRKIDEYFTAVREIEQRIAQATVRRKDVPQRDLPDGVPAELKEHLRLMYDIMALAFQTDTTRVATFMVGNAGSNKNYPDVGVRGGWHSLSHHRNDKNKIDSLSKIDRYHATQFASFLGRLKSIREGEGTLLDNSMILYGSAIADGNRHTHHDLPILLAGRGGGTIRPGRYLQFPKDTPLNNLFVSMAGRAGANIDTLGDSTGPLPRLEG